MGRCRRALGPLGLLLLASCQGVGPAATGQALRQLSPPPGPAGASPRPDLAPTQAPVGLASSALSPSPSPFLGRPAAPTSQAAPSLAPSPPAPSPAQGPSPAVSSAPSPAPSQGLVRTELTPPAVVAREVSYTQVASMQGPQRARALVLVSTTEQPPGGRFGPMGASARRLLGLPSERRAGLCGLGGGAGAPPRVMRRLLQAVGLGGTLGFSVGPGFGVPSRAVSARAVAAGQGIVVLVDVAEEADATRHAGLVAKAQRLVAAFDGGIRTRNEALFGEGPQVVASGDPRLHLVVSSAVDDGGRAPIPAYFSPGDQGDRQVLHLAVSHLDRAEADWLGTLAHEHQHLINHHHKVRLGGAPDLESLWIDEGLAMVAMQANGYGFGSGADLFPYQGVQYLNAPGAFSLSEWAGNPEGRGYGGAYFFLQHLSDRFGEAFLKAVVTHPQRGLANLDARLRERGSSFAQAFTDFGLTLLVANRAPQLPPEWGFKTFRMGLAMAPPELPAFAIEDFTTGSQALRPLQVRLVALPPEGPWRWQGPGVQLGAPLVLPPP